MRSFPGLVSITITNRCNLRCQMCGQWSQEGYMHGRERQHLELDVLKSIVDEVAGHEACGLLIRGGEPFLYPGLLELLEHSRQRGVAVSIDSNGTLIEKYAERLAPLAIDHITISVDGPEHIHDEVRQSRGCYAKIKQGVAALNRLKDAGKPTPHLGICFTISAYSYKGLGVMPDVARDLGISQIVIVPYYWVAQSVGKQYERLLRSKLGCEAYSWRGFHHETSGVNLEEFAAQLATFNDRVGDLEVYPYMPLNEEQFRIWFGDCTTPIHERHCRNVHGLLDVQPDGSVNFCVDFPDYVIGNIGDASLAELWTSERASQFRELRDSQELPVCLRCGARFMAPVSDTQ